MKSPLSELAIWLPAGRGPVGLNIVQRQQGGALTLRPPCQQVRENVLRKTTVHNGGVKPFRLRFRILNCTPHTLRRQWHIDMFDAKFFQRITHGIDDRRRCTDTTRFALRL